MIEYTLTEDGTLTISGQGIVEHAEWTEEELLHDEETGGGWSDWFSHCSQFAGMDVRRVVIEEGVTGLADESFVLLDLLEEVVLPESISFVGRSVFSGCGSLVKISLPSSLKTISASMFCGCKSLKRIVIPEGVESISCDSFEHCESLEFVSLPSTLNHIAERAFNECPNLTSIESKSPDYIMRNGYLCSKDGEVVLGTGQTDVIVPDDIKSIQCFAFSYNDKITSVVVPKGTDKGYNAFSYCRSLRKVVYCPEGEDVGMDGAFEGCSSLKEVVISDGVKVIAKHMFAFCESLESVYVPDSVKRIEARAFFGCENLREIRLPDDIVISADSVFDECPCAAGIHSSRLEQIEAKTDGGDLPF